MKRYAINSQYNMRDLGGYATTDNQFTALGKIIRSDYPKEFILDDIKQLERLGIGCVIDLRTSEEAKQKPSYFAEKELVDFYNVSFENGNDMPESEESISHTYFKMMEEADAINTILRIIAESKTSVLYHCAVGKDRTGLISAIILSICGVPKEEIIADYQVSETYIAELLYEYKNKNPELPEWLGRSKPEYMRECLAMLESKYGSFKGYVEALKIPQKTIASIRKKLEVKGDYLPY